MRTSVILTLILIFVKFSSSQIPLLNIAANATASIAANSSQNLATGTKSDLISKLILDGAQNQSTGTDNQSTTATEAKSGQNSTISTLPAQNANETESNDARNDSNEGTGQSVNEGTNEQLESENIEERSEAEGELTIDEVLLPDTENAEVPVTPKSAGEDEDEDRKVRSSTNKPRGKQSSKKSKKSKRIEKLVCHAEIEIDPEEPIFAENFEKYFE